MVEYKYFTDSLSDVLSNLARTNTFSLDLETTGLNPHDSRILLCQVGFRFGGDKVNYIVNAERINLTPLVPFINSWNWRKISHNTKFESQFMEHFYHTDMKNAWDTQLADRICYPEAFSNSLESVADRILGIKLNKKIRESFFKLNNRGEYSEKQLEYAAQDVDILWDIMDHQIEKLASIGQEKIAELEFNLAPVVGDMELTGIPIDAPRWRQILEDYRDLHEESRIRMNGLIFDGGQLDEQMGMFSRDGINLGSHPQVLRAFNKLGIDIEKTDAQTISRINHPLARELTTFRKLDKLLTSYGSTFLDQIHPFTGRLHPNFQQIGADTGRFSCREPNVQQIPPKLRVCVGGLENYKVVGADFSQMELRVIAELSEDKKLIEAFQRGLDVHMATASLMFNKPLGSISKEERFAAKTINFGIAYGMGGEKLKDTINAENQRNGIKTRITVKQAYILKNKHKEAYPQLREWLDETGNRAFRENISFTMYGRKRFFTKPDRAAMEEKEYDNRVASIKRQGANTPIQGTNADITKLAMLNLHEDLSRYKMNAHIINQVHDEIVLLAHFRQAEEVKMLVEESMIQSAQQLLTKVPVVVDAYVADVWPK